MTIELSRCIRTGNGEIPAIGRRRIRAHTRPHSGADPPPARPVRLESRGGTRMKATIARLATNLGSLATSYVARAATVKLG